MATRIATYDDPLVVYDDPTCAYDGEINVPDPVPIPTLAISGTGGASHSLLTPQVILNRGTGGEWSKEEAERWLHRLKLTEKERQEQEAIEEEEAIAALLFFGLL